jgi:hypothetical protein
LAILNNLKKDQQVNEEIEKIKDLEKQARGDYSKIIKMKVQQKDVSNQYFLNHVKGLSVQWSKDKGRGVFAEADIPKGALMIVDKAVSIVKIEGGGAKTGFYWQENRSVNDQGMREHVDSCNEIAQMKGI